MHRDEERDPLRLEQQISDDFVSDPRASYRKFQGMAAREKQLRRQLDILRREQSSRTVQTGRLHRQHRSLSERNVRLQEHNDRLRERLAVMTQREERLQSRIAHLEEQNAALKDRADRWKERSTRLQERMTQLPPQGEANSPSVADLTRAHERLTEMQRTITALEQELTGLREQQPSAPPEVSAAEDTSAHTATYPVEPAPTEADPTPAPATRDSPPHHTTTDEEHPEVPVHPRPTPEHHDATTHPSEGAEPTAQSEGADPTSAPTEGGSRTSEAPATAPRASLAELYTFEDLWERMQREPSLEALHGALLRAWYHDGEVTRALSLLEDHAEVAEQLNRPGRQVAERLRGFARLTDRAEGWIPPRSEGAAYVPERGRVLYCVHSTPIYHSNGYSTRTRGIAQAIRAAGAEVRVVGRAGYPWDARGMKSPPVARTVSTLDAIDYVHLPGPDEHADPLDHIILEMADAFVREARMYRPSVIQAASNYRTGLAALIAGRRLGIPVVYEIRGLWELTELSAKPNWGGSERFGASRELESLVARESDHVLAITHQVAHEMSERGVPAGHISLAPNGVDPEQFAPIYRDDRALAEAGVTGDGTPVIGFAGSMVDYEGLDLLLEASELLVQRGVKHTVLLVGSGAVEERLRRQASDHHLDHVRFLGRVPQQRVPRLMSGMDIVACPRRSTPVTELVSPLKPLEAMGSGTAVVLSDVAPHRDLAADGRAALFRTGDAQDLARVLEPLLLDPDARAVLARRARAWVTSERSWATIGRHLVQAHGRAASELAQRAPQDGPALADLQVGIVADEFTRTTIGAQVRLEPLGRKTWRQQLEATHLDLVILESAWANHDDWHRGVGFYSPEENAHYRALISECRRRGIPTVFWNKEDPVHFNRFVRSAVQCDHIFTTDGATIPAYLQRTVGTGRKVTVSSMPFYAAPTLHNPLPGRHADVHGVCYAGTYYGSRYPERSEVLASLLRTAQPFGLKIYDRQQAVPDSPYHFPEEFSGEIEGALPYDEVLDAYKAQVANLNVNSVVDSPTMFSRRVVEIAASGGVVLSGPGRGIVETFGSAIACSPLDQVWRSWLRSWTTDPHARLEEAWLQMRAVLRAHTTEHALTIMARTAGIAVRAEGLPEYTAYLPSPDRHTVHSLTNQSVAPSQIVLGTAVPDEWLGDLGATSSVRVAGPGEVAEPWIAFDTPRDRTFAEDLLHSTRWGDWSWVVSRDLREGETGMPFAVPVQEHDADVHLRTGRTGTGLVLTRPAPPMLIPATDATRDERGIDPSPDLTGTRLLVAGHDLKFATDMIEAAEQAGAAVEIDLWASHTEHDEARSRELLDRADVIFCEWGLGNAVWYSQHLAAHQRLVVRVHAQELRRPYLSRVRSSAVDRFVFVGELIRRSAIVSHGVPADKTVVIPNGVDVEAMRQPKLEQDVSRHLGLVGIVPRAKRLDLALDVLERLRRQDPGYRLFIKGKTPDDFPWMAHRPEEMSYYDEQFARIDAMNASAPGTVVLDGHGDDVPDWFRKIGVALSVSDHESFHFTPADGAVSGALPAVLAWPGADLIYPSSWLAHDLDELVDRIRTTRPSDEGEIVAHRFGATRVLPRLLAQLLPKVD